MPKEILRLGGILCIITLVVALMLSGVNLLTRDIIAQNTLRAENDARAEIIPAESFEDMGDGIYAAKKSGEIIGYCVSVESSGFGGKISMIVGIIISNPVLTLIGAEGGLLKLAVRYTVIYFLGAPFISITNYFVAIFRAKGDTRTPLAILSLSGLCNVILNWIVFRYFAEMPFSFVILL